MVMITPVVATTLWILELVTTYSTIGDGATNVKYYSLTAILPMGGVPLEAVTTILAAAITV
jgi:hypothetical protein